MIAVIILMVFTNIFTVGCVHVAYRLAGKYREHIILGVTLKEEQFRESDVQKVVADYNSVFLKTMIGGYITAILVMLPIKWYMSIWLIVYMLWLFGVIGVSQWLYTKYHKKLYALKKARGFICGKVINEITIDTKLSIAKGKMAISPGYFLLSIAIVLLPLLSEKFRTLLWEEKEITFIMYGTIMIVKAAYILMYYLFVRQRSVVYSQNSEVNIACNRVSKRGFSIIFLTACTLDSISYLTFLGDLANFRYISFVSVILFIVLQLGIVFGIVIGLFRIKEKRDEIKKQADTVCVVDEDEYWEKGYYYNPKDNRLFIQDRDNGMHMSMNMAKKSAWVITGITILGTLAVVVWTSVIMLRLDFVETKYMVEDKLQILAPSYPLTVEFDDITDIKLIEKLPDVRMSKDNGAATDQYSIGKFHIRNQGSCWLYVYHGYSPIVEVKTKEQTIYFNSKTEGVAEECYRKLQEKIQE